MGGPWRARGFDPVAWRRQPPRVAARADPADDGGTARLVLAYVLTVVAACAALLLLLARLA